MGGNEDSIEEAKKSPLDFLFKNTKFVVNWASATALFTLLSSTIYFFQDNRQLKETVKQYKHQIVSLKTSDSLKTLQITELAAFKDIMNNAINGFMENPPSGLNRRLTKMEEEIERYHSNSNFSTMRNDSIFVNVPPPRFIHEN